MLVSIKLAAERICKDYRKRETRRLSHIASTLDDLNNLSYNPFEDEADSVLQFLSEEEYNLLKAYYTEDYGNRAGLAEKYGMTTTQLYKKICSIRKKVAQHLKRKQPEKTDAEQNGV